MAFQEKEMFQAMVASVNDCLQKDGATLGREVFEVMKEHKASLEELAQAYTEGEITKEEFEEELDREKQLLQAELLTLKICSAAAVQNAVNTAIGCVKSTLKLC